MKNIVLDNGSGACKIGFSGDDDPAHVIRTVVGHNNNAETFVGNDAVEKQSLGYPMQYGCVTNWDDMERLWRHAFYDKMGITPKNHRVLLTEASLTPKSNREKMAQIMFEKFQVPAIFVANQGVLSLYANGLMTGVSLDSGDGVTQVVPVENGYAIADSITRVNLAGSDLTDYLSKIVKSDLDKETYRCIKEKLCYVSLDFDKEISDATYTLPDGKILQVGDASFRCPEAIFRPSLVGSDKDGFHKLIYHSIAKSDEALQGKLYSGIVLSGGTTLLPNFETRIKNELEKLSPAKKIKVVAKPDRKNCVWMGGSLLTTMSDFQKMWITKEQYNETGPSILHQCP